MKIQIQPAEECTMEITFPDSVDRLVQALTKALFKYATKED